MQPEEVQPASFLEFPAAAAGRAGVDWLPIAALALGALGTLLGGYSLLRSRK